MQAVTFSGAPGVFSSEKWRDLLESFGDVRMFCVSSVGETGYCLYEQKKCAVAAAETLHESLFEGNEVSFQLCDLEEMEMVVKLSDPRLKNVSLADPKSAAEMFSVTQTQPPIYWRQRC